MERLRAGDLRQLRAAIRSPLVVLCRRGIRASTDDTTRLKELLAPLERPVIRDGKRSRALRPFDDQDRLLLEAISRGEFIINCFRNKDMQELLYENTAQSVKETRRRSGGDQP